MTRVLAFGTFDIFHPGHERHLQAAAACGDELVVVVARDETVLAVKGRAPHHAESERVHYVASLPYVALAVLGYPGDKLRIIEEMKPDVIALGYDQHSFTEELAEKLAARGLHPKIVRTEAFEPERYKSSKLRKD